MGICPAQVEEERCFVGCVGSDVVGAEGSDVFFDAASIVDSVFPHPLQPVFLVPLPDGRGGRDNRVLVEADALHLLAVQRAVRGLDHADAILVESLIRGPALLLRSEVPLAGHRRRIATIAEQFRDRDLVRGQRVGCAADDDAAQARAWRIAPGHQRST